MKLLRWNNARPQGPQRKRQNREPRIADRGWKSRRVSPLPVEGEIFFLTFPFIDQAIALRMQIRPRPPLRIWRKNGSASACPRVSRAALPDGVAFRTGVSRTPA